MEENCPASNMCASNLIPLPSEQNLLHLKIAEWPITFAASKCNNKTHWMQRQRKLFRSAFDCDFSRFRHRFCSLVVNCGGKRRTFVLRLATCCMSHSPTGQRRLGGRIFDKFAGFDSRMRWFSKQWIPRWVNAGSKMDGGLDHATHEANFFTTHYRIEKSEHCK